MISHLIVSVKKSYEASSELRREMGMSVGSLEIMKDLWRSS